MNITRTIATVTAFCINIAAFGQQTWNIINNPNGTVVIQGTTLNNYTIEPAIKFRVITSCNQGTLSYNGSTRNGTPAPKGSIVEVGITNFPIASAITPIPAPNGFSQIWRSADLVFTYDSAKLELIEAVPDSLLTDARFIDIPKIAINRLAPGVAIFHSQCLPAPELRTPKLGVQPWVWNFGGFVWANSNRHLGKLRFKVISDFYYPVQQPTDIRIVPEATVNGIVIKSIIDGSPTASTNIIGDIQNNALKIKSGPSSDYKFDLKLQGPTNTVAIGDIVDVKIVITPSSLPQILAFVSTVFAWDKTKLEFMGTSAVGAKLSIMSSIDMVCPTCVNEIAIPKDGTAHHNFLNNLGDKTPIASQTLIVTLKFKAISNFTTTTVEVISQTDPRVAGQSILDDTGIDFGGINTITNATIIGTP
jgi:hypothetical protein